MLGLVTMSGIRELEEYTGDEFDYSWLNDSAIYEQFAAGNPGLMLVHLVATVICIYLICTICYFVYSAVAKPVSNVIAKKIGNYRNFTI